MTGPAPFAVRALICEDEPLARRALEEYLADVAWIELVGEATNGSEAVRLIHKLEPDLIFLDVRMPGLTGLEVLDTITHEPAVVFTTAYDEYAVQAFDLGAIDYLVKPFGRQRLLETLSRVRVRMVGEGRPTAGGAAGAKDGRRFAERLFGRHRGAIVPVSTASIVRIDATTGGVTLRCEGGTYDLDSTLGEIEQRLDPTDFLRVHRSHIVNLTHVASIRRYDERRLEIRLTDDSSVVASRKGSSAFREIMNS